MSLRENRIVDISGDFVTVQLENSEIVSVRKSELCNLWPVQILDPIKLVKKADGNICISKREIKDNRLKRIKCLPIAEYMKNSLKINYKYFRKVSEKDSFFKAFSLCILENLFRFDLDENFEVLLKSKCERAQELIKDEDHMRAFVQVEELIKCIHNGWDYDTSINNCLSDSLFEIGLVYYSKYLLLVSLEEEKDDVLQLDLESEILFTKILQENCEIEDLYFKGLSKLLELDLNVVSTSAGFLVLKYSYGAIGFHLFQYADHYYPLISRGSALLLEAKEIDKDFYSRYLKYYKEQNQSQFSSFNSSLMDDSRFKKSMDSKNFNLELEKIGSYTDSELFLNTKIEQKCGKSTNASCLPQLDIVAVPDPISILPNDSIVNEQLLRSNNNQQAYSMDRNLESAVKIISKNINRIEYTPQIDMLQTSLVNRTQYQDIVEEFPLAICEKCMLQTNDVVNLPCKHRFCFIHCQEMIYEFTNGLMILNDRENFKSDPCCPLCLQVFDINYLSKGILEPEIYQMYLEESKHRAKINDNS